VLDEVPSRKQAVLIPRTGSRRCPVGLEPRQGPGSRRATAARIAAGSRSGNGTTGCSPDTGRWLMKPMLTHPSDSRQASSGARPVERQDSPQRTRGNFTLHRELGHLDALRVDISRMADRRGAPGGPALSGVDGVAGSESRAGRARGVNGGVARTGSGRRPGRSPGPGSSSPGSAGGSSSLSFASWFESQLPGTGAR
jgi:hypothetical protein